MSRINLKRLQELKDKGLVSIQRHPTLSLLIHNYTQRCQYEKAWDESTIQCRGLITDLEGNIVARPFPKFFNLGEHEQSSVLPRINWQQDFVATEKIDGSLGILYDTPEGHAIATRGSFVSDQAIKAMQIFKDKGYSNFPLNPDLTYLFEIIYPENRIVLDYGDMEDLVLLDIIDTETGNSLPWNDIKFFADAIGSPVVKLIPADSKFIQECAKANPSNAEGYVVRFSDGMRIKVKFEEYVRLHKLITGITAKSIWENLMNGNDLSELLDRVPDEFYEWVKNTKHIILDMYKDVELDCAHAFQQMPKRHGSRKQFAELAMTEKYPAVLFAMLDRKDYASLIWKLIKPKYSIPFKHES